MFKWPVIVSFALSSLYFLILIMSLEETLSPTAKGELPLTFSSYSYQSKFVRKALKFLTNTEIPGSFRCNLLLFNCLFGFILLSVIIAICFSTHIPSIWAFTIPTIFLKLSAGRTVLETIFLLFSVFIDLARVTISSEISFGDLFKGRSFVPTWATKISGVKSLSVGNM